MTDTTSNAAFLEQLGERKVVLLWDMLKVPFTFHISQVKLRKSEEDEFSRVLGPELIEKLEV